MVGSEIAANRVMKSISKFMEEKLGLKVNVAKSKVDKPKGVKYLGFGFYYDTFAKQYKAKPHAKSVAKFKGRMKQLTCRSWGVSNDYKVQKLNQLMRGWINYFKIGSMKKLCGKLDSQIRYRLRMCIWKHWKTPKNKAKQLIKLGVPPWSAWKTAYLHGYARPCRCGDAVVFQIKRCCFFQIKCGVNCIEQMKQCRLQEAVSSLCFPFENIYAD
ncbi:MAG: hypothetical protein H2212_09330 [Ruminococcus sp.]|nr:hypothetical protein [Ruminococcus sp.]